MSDRCLAAEVERVTAVLAETVTAIVQALRDESDE